jgi:hypothetical protein
VASDLSFDLHGHLSPVFRCRNSNIASTVKSPCSAVFCRTFSWFICRLGKIRRLAMIFVLQLFALILFAGLAAMLLFLLGNTVLCAVISAWKESGNAKLPFCVKTLLDQWKEAK